MIPRGFLRRLIDGADHSLDAERDLGIHLVPVNGPLLQISVLRIRIRMIHIFLDLPDPDPLGRDTDLDPSIFKQK